MILTAEDGFDANEKALMQSVVSFKGLMEISLREKGKPVARGLRAEIVIVWISRNQSPEIIHKLADGAEAKKDGRDFIFQKNEGIG